MDKRIEDIKNAILAKAAARGLHRVDTASLNQPQVQAPPEVGPRVEPQGQPQAKPCGSCGEAARQRRIAQRAKREADQAAKDLTQS